MPDEVTYARASAAYWAGQAVDSLISGFRHVTAGDFPHAHVELFVAHHTAEYAYQTWKDWQVPEGRKRDPGRRQNVRTR